MEFDTYQVRTLYTQNPMDAGIVSEFLESQELDLEAPLDYTIGLFDGNQLIGTGSLAGNVLKCIAIDPRYQGTGLSNKIVSELVSRAYELGRTHLFIFTKPENVAMFHDMGFYPIESEAPFVTLLENKAKGLQEYIEKLSGKVLSRENQAISSIVMNCNPFTLGHQYLIEQAAAECDQLHLFVVWEDRSSFPNEVRLRLIQEGTRHLKNVYIHKGEHYIVSSATFPSYFIKKKTDLVEIHCRLDLKIFAGHIAPALGITRRYIGHEPYCQVTATYNQIMKEVLPKYGIEVREIQRRGLEYGEALISASAVRMLLREGKWDQLINFVPVTTLAYLKSEDAQPVLRKIMTEESRH